MPTHLRAFLFDAHHPTAIVEQLHDTWDKGIAACVINAQGPRSLIDAAIIACDPTHVYEGDEVRERINAIVQTPDLASVVLTSGTTHNPTPVELSFASLHASAHSLSSSLSLKSTDTWLCCLPPYYIAGLSIIARGFSTGSRIIFHEAFDVERVRSCVEQNEIRIMSLVPTQLRDLLDAEVSLSDITLLIGGSSCPDDLRKRCREASLDIRLTYGLTETWGGICHDGTMLDGNSVRINDGLIEVSTPSLMSGYRHNAPLTSERTTDDGWFRTLDRGEIIDDNLVVYGRLDDIIISGGIKIDPVPLEREYKRILTDYDFVLCATPHQRFGQCVTVCFTHPYTGASIDTLRDKLRSFVNASHLPIKFATVPEFPRTSSGKIQRARIAEMCTVISEYEPS